MPELGWNNESEADITTVDDDDEASGNVSTVVLVSSTTRVFYLFIAHTLIPSHQHQPTSRNPRTTHPISPCPPSITVYAPIALYLLIDPSFLGRSPAQEHRQSQLPRLSRMSRSVTVTAPILPSPTKGLTTLLR